MNTRVLKDLKNIDTIIMTKFFLENIWNLCSNFFFLTLAPRKQCPYSELFWSILSGIQIQYGEIRSMSPYSVRMQKSTDQNDSEYGHFSRTIGKFCLFPVCSPTLLRFNFMEKYYANFTFLNLKILLFFLFIFNIPFWTSREI